MQVLRNQPADAISIGGVNPKGLDAVAEIFGSLIGEAVHPGAQLSIFRNGELMVELAAGLDGLGLPVRLDSLLGILSTTKALTSLVVHMLHDRGVFDYDHPVARHWPEFARNGKDRVTIRQILSHRSGLSPDVYAGYLDWRKWPQPGGIERLIEDMELFWVPGEKNGYHALTFGHVFDVLARKWTGKNIGQLLRQEICNPLGIKDAYIGLPEKEMPRFSRFSAVPWRAMIPGLELPPGGEEHFFNSYEILRQSLPWGSGVARARDLARLMNVYAFEGSFEGREFFSKETFDLAVRPTNGPQDVDVRIQTKVRWGLGLMVDHTEGVRGISGPIFGAKASPRACGHMGGNSSLSWADPDRRLAVSFISTRAPIEGRYAELADAILAACD
jgi:CubicO group peptidase (beta-lactamase class C family)